MKERYSSAGIVVLCFLGIVIRCYGLPAKYLVNDSLDFHRRNPRDSPCPSCRQDSAAALVSPWYGEPRYSATSCGCHYEPRPEVPKQCGQNYHFSNPYARVYQYPRYNRAVRSRVPKSADPQHNGSPAQFAPQYPPRCSVNSPNPEPSEAPAQNGITKEEYDAMMKSSVPYEEQQYPTAYYEVDGAEGQYADNNGQSFYPKQENYPQEDFSNWQERIPQKYSEAEAFESPKVSSQGDRRIDGQEAASGIGQTVIESESEAAYQQHRQQQQSSKLQQERQYKRRYETRPRRVQSYPKSERQVQRFEQPQQQQENRFQDNGRDQDLEYYLRQQLQYQQENEQQQQLQQLRERQSQYQENLGQVQIEESQRFAQEEQYNKRHREQTQAQQQQVLQRRQGRDSYDAFDKVAENKQNSQRRLSIADTLAKIRNLRQRDAPIYDQKNHWTIRELFDADAPEETTVDVSEDESQLEIIARDDVGGSNGDGHLNIEDSSMREHEVASLKDDFFQDDRTIVDDGEFNNEKSIFQRDLSGTYGSEAREEMHFDPDLIDDVEHPPPQATEIPIKRSTFEESTPSA